MSIHRLAVVVAACVSVVVVGVAAPSAAGHPGDIWYQTAARTELDIERKYPGVLAASCQPLPAWARARYDADSIVRNNARAWDHLYCGVYSAYLDAPCLVVAHMMGRRWDQIMLTSWPRNGCSTRALWG